MPPPSVRGINGLEHTHRREREDARTTNNLPSGAAHGVAKTTTKKRMGKVTRSSPNRMHRISRKHVSLTFAVFIHPIPAGGKLERQTHTHARLSPLGVLPAGYRSSVQQDLVGGKRNLKFRVTTSKQLIPRSSVHITNFWRWKADKPLVLRQVFRASPSVRFPPLPNMASECWTFLLVFWSAPQVSICVSFLYIESLGFAGAIGRGK